MCLVSHRKTSIVFVCCDAEEACLSKLLPEIIRELIVVVSGLGEIVRYFSSNEFDCTFSELFEVGCGGWGEAFGVFGCGGVSYRT